MKQWMYILIVGLSVGCAKNASKNMEVEASNAVQVPEEKTTISEEDAYTLLITQKLQEYLDQQALAETHPDFDIQKVEDDGLFSTHEKQLKSIQFIAPFEWITDSIKSVKTKVIFDATTDTLITYIQTSETEIDGETFKTTNITFGKPSATKTSTASRSATSKSIRTEKFSLKDLSFTWKEIDACDCLFMVKAKNTAYKRLYFARFKGDSTGILQLGRNTKKYMLPIEKHRSKNRKPGASWVETYQNDLYKIKVNATTTKPKIKGKFSYYINFTLDDLKSKEVIKSILLVNCKS